MPLNKNGHLSYPAQSFYDKGDSELERGDLWSILTANGERPGANDMLDFDKNIQAKYAHSLNITNGKIDAHPDSMEVIYLSFHIQNKLRYTTGV